MDGEVAVVAPMQEALPPAGGDTLPSDERMADVTMTSMDQDEDNLSDFTDEGACLDGGE